MKIKSLILSLTFLIMLISPVLAYYSTDLSVNMTLENSIPAFDCVNASDDGNIYCFMGSSDAGSGNVLRRVDINFENAVVCSMGAYTAKGLIAINKTLAWIGHGEHMWLRNVTDCGALVQKNSVLSAYPKSGDAYLNGTTRWLYWGETTNKVLNETGDLQQTLGYPFGSFENDSVNSTQYFVWGANLTVTKAVNGVNTTNVTSLCLGFNICNAGDFRSNVIKVSPSTTWMFIKETLPAANHYTFHRINLTKYTGTNWTSCSLLTPQNTSYGQGESITFSTSCYAESSTAGTLMWFIDGANIANASATVTAASQTFYYASGVLGDGGHYAHVGFIDADGNTFTTNPTYFTVESLGLFPLMAGWVGGLLGIEDVDIQNLLLSVLLSLICALIITHYIKRYSGQVFLASFFALFFVFILAGFVPSWIAILILIVTGLFLIQTISKFGGG